MGQEQSYEYNDFKEMLVKYNIKYSKIVDPTKYKESDESKLIHFVDYMIDAERLKASIYKGLPKNERGKIWYLYCNIDALKIKTTLDYNFTSSKKLY